MIDFFTTLPLAGQFQTATVLIICAFLIVLGLLFFGPVIAKDAHDLFPDEAIEDDEQRFAAAKRRAHEELRRQVPHQVDAGDRRALLRAIGQMSAPTNRVH